MYLSVKSKSYYQIGPFENVFECVLPQWIIFTEAWAYNSILKANKTTSNYM